MICTHQGLTRDICLFMLVVLGFFVVREVFTWFFKSNHVLDAVAHNTESLRHIQQLLLSLTQP